MKVIEIYHKLLYDLPLQCFMVFDIFEIQEKEKENKKECRTLISF